MKLKVKKLKVEKARLLGRILAGMVRSEFNTRNTKVIAERLGIKIGQGTKGDFGELQIYGSYNHKLKRITITDRTGPNDHLVAHELFHYYENKNHIKQASKELSEVSARSFAIKLLDPTI